MKRKIVFLAIYLVFLTILVYVGWVGWRANQIYNYVKTNQQGEKGRIYKYDPDLGFALLPGGEGAQVYPVGPEIPIKIDLDGFRIPANQSNSIASRRRPLILALGCSFTFGDGCAAEDTFPYLVGRELNGTSLNAGVSSYGLAQMLILARKLIPKYKPDYVLVQYSPWLAERSQQYFAPTYFGILPTPFFVYTDDNSISICPPLFRTKLFDVPIGDYYSTKTGVMDYLSFLIRAGFPLLSHDDFNILVCYIKNLAGVLPKPVSDKQEFENRTYGKIEELCEKYGAAMLIIIMGTGPPPTDIPNLNLRHAVIVDAQFALYSRLEDKSKESYMKAYGHYQGTPPVFIDGHPNPFAHKIIASEIIKQLNH